VALLQIASLFGWYGVSFVILLATAAVLEGVRSVAAGRADRALRAVALASGVVALSVGYGEWCLHHRADGLRPLRVAVVQPVITPEVYEYQAIDPAYRRFAKETVRRLSAQAAALRPDLLLWPEGGNGQVNFRIPALRHEIRSLAHRSGATLLVSTHDLDAQARLFNTVFAVSPRGRVLGRYAKIRLTPVAEREFTPGRSVEPLRTSHGPVGTLLCWESAFSSIARRLVRNGAVLLFVSTSDASLRHSSLTFLHGRAAVLRAIENRRPLVQASNAGPSLLVTAYGEVAGETPLDGRAVLVGDVTPAAGETPFTRFGDGPLLGAALAILALATSYSRRRGRRGPARRVRPTAPAAAVAVFVAAAVGLVTAAASIARIGMDIPAFHGSWRAALEGFARAPTIALPDGAEFQQSRENTCGPAALAQMLSSLGVDVTETELLRSVPIHPDGASMGDLAAATRRLGLLSWGERQDLDALEQCPLPVLAHVRGNHYVVVQRFEPGGLVDVFDPAEGYVRIPVDGFRRAWDGYVLIARFARIPGWRDGEIPRRRGGSARVGEERAREARDLGRALLVDEELRVRDAVEARDDRELRQHRARPRFRERRVVGAPDEERRHREPAVERRELVEPGEVHHAEEASRAVEPAVVPDQRLDEETVELAVQPAEVVEAAAEPERRPPEDARAEEEPDARREPGKPRHRLVHRDPRRPMPRDLRVREHEARHARAVQERELPRDPAAGVVADERVPLDAELRQRLAERAGLPG
jgi:predicted amidohydrolase